MDYAMLILMEIMYYNFLYQDRLHDILFATFLCNDNALSKAALDVPIHHLHRHKISASNYMILKALIPNPSTNSLPQEAPHFLSSPSGPLQEHYSPPSS